MSARRTLLLLFAAASATQAAAQSARLVFTCVDATGRTLTSDRLIAACMDREQRIEIVRRQILERAGAHVARIGDDRIDAPEAVERGFDDCAGAFR